ncbi:helix-turn-helix domain-containing protein [Nannocystis pusilla]|uniref:helix-turn-helix domain-containing protein n=1 Tax=Nannocystis pusilla TaxID=889268 RepID=UPI003B80EB1F
MVPRGDRKSAKPRSDNAAALDLLTVDEVATMLKTSRKAIYHRISRGQIPPSGSDAASSSAAATWPPASSPAPSTTPEQPPIAPSPSATGPLTCLASAAGAPAAASP